MGGDPIPGLLREVDAGRIRADLFHLAKDPLPFRKLNYTLPGHEQCTLYEADAFIQGRLEALGYAVEREACRVQAYRCDAAKPKHHQYATPEPDDPWYTAYNLSVRKAGTTHPDEIIVLIAHKDSQSWVDSPGANDNAIGTACVLELARVLADRPSERSLWFLFCNEEHTPWTSITAARNARERGDNIVAAINMDGPGTRSAADREAGRMTNFAVYYAPEAERLADLMAEVNGDYGLGLVQKKHQVERPNNDDGSFIKEGYTVAVHNIGSVPYGDPHYHLPGDIPERVDVANAAATTRAVLAAVLRIDGGWLVGDAPMKG